MDQTRFLSVCSVNATATYVVMYRELWMDLWKIHSLLIEANITQHNYYGVCDGMGHTTACCHSHTPTYLISKLYTPPSSFYTKIIW